MLAIRRGWQGKGCGGLLLLFALRTALKVSHDVGSFAIVAQPFDEHMLEFYGKWRFQDVPFDPGSAMIFRMADLEQSWSAAETMAPDVHWNDHSVS